jgi:hypothetical protein
MKWRIYRLPGSRENWHIDAGCIRHVFNVKHWQSNVTTRAVEVGGNHVPRAWIEIDGADLHIMNGVAVFDYRGVMDAVREALDGKGIEVKDAQ